MNNPKNVPDLFKFKKLKIFQIKNIIVFLLVIFLFIPISNYEISIINIANGKSVWNLNTDNDFKSGTIDNLTINGVDLESTLSLNFSMYTQWSRIKSIFEPGVRNFDVISTIFNEDKILLFGGSTDDFLNDTWIYDLSSDSWKQIITPGPSPSKRERVGLAPIYNDDKIVLFGGVGDKIYNDTWVFDLSDNKWSLKLPIISPEIKHSHVMSTVYGDDKIVLFGGKNPNPSNDTWVYDLSDNVWVKKSPKNSPSIRNLFSMATVYGTKKVVLFGGTLNNNFYRDLWIYNLNNDSWEKKDFIDEPRPSTRYGHAMSTIYGSDQILLFGGQTSTKYYNDTWTYSLNNNTWTKKEVYLSTGNNVLDITMASIHKTNKVILVSKLTDNECWLYESYQYYKYGNFTSIPYDTNSNSTFYKIFWDGDFPKECMVRFQLKTADTKDDLNSKEFVGPDGSRETFYLYSNQTIWSGHERDRWIQLKTLVNTTNNYITSIIDEIKILYNCHPFIEIIEIKNNLCLNNNTPLFKWKFSDYDSQLQIGFRILIDDEYSFTSIDFKSGERNTSICEWQFPIGTTFTEIPDGTWYWKLEIKDQDDIWINSGPPIRFIVDTVKPKSTIELPQKCEYYNDLNIIKGTAFDTQPSSGLKEVLINIHRNNDFSYWDGTDWGKKEIWLTTNGTYNWEYNLSSVYWTSRNHYTIRSRCVDNSSNFEMITPGVVIYFDIESPEAFIESPEDNSYINKIKEITGSARDFGGSGINNILIYIRRENDGTYMNGSQWTNDLVWNNAIINDDGLWFWKINQQLLKSGENYIITTRAIDIAGNIEFPGQENIFMFDNRSPSYSSIMINNGDKYTNSFKIMLTLQVIDNESGPFKMYFSNDNITWTDWYNYKTQFNYNITDIENDGKKFIYFKVKDRANNTAKIVFDYIYFDRTPPKNLSMTINNGALITDSQIVILNLSAYDELNGLDLMAFSTNGVAWTKWEKFNSTKIYELQSGNGHKKIYFKVKDQAGNEAKPVSQSITLNIVEESNKNDNGSDNNDFNQSIIILFIMLILLLIIVGSFLFLKYKKHKRSILPNIQTTTIKPKKKYDLVVEDKKIVLPNEKGLEFHRKPLVIEAKITSQPPELKGLTQPPMGETKILEGEVCFTCGQQLYFVKSVGKNYCFHCRKYEIE